MKRTVISFLLSSVLFSGFLPGQSFAAQEVPENTPVTNLVSIQSRLFGPNPMAFEKFGSSVSVSEGTAVIGSPGATTPQINQGSVTVFIAQGSAWSLQAGLAAPDGAANDLFGTSVAISGNTLVVGARGATVTQAGQGAAYVFTRTGTAWTFQTKLVPTDAAAGDAFGSSVAIFGNTIVVGASRKTLTETGQGAAYLFSRSGNAWSQTARLTASDKRANDQFGASVAINGNLVVVGAPFNDNFGVDQGAGYVFELKSTGWGQVAKLLSTDGRANDFFGASVAVTGRTALVGAPGASPIRSGQGAAYVCEDIGGNAWQQTARLTSSEAFAGDRFGSAVALAGRNAIVGAPGVDVNGILDQGAAFTFHRRGSSWTANGRLAAVDGQTFDYFGQSVSLNGGIAIAGTPGADTNQQTDQGAAYVLSGFAGNPSTPGAFRPSNGFTYLRNSNSTGFANLEFFYGIAGDIPLSGDWDGDGITSVGIYRNGSFFLRNGNSAGNAHLQFPFGSPGDIPVVGDWDGDGIDTVGIVRGNTIFLRNSNTAGNADLQFAYGSSTDNFIVGDWNGDGIDTIGAFRPSNGFVYLRNSNTTGVADLEFFYGQAGDKPIVGDWNEDGIDTIGIVRGNQWFLRNSNSSGFADLLFSYGTASDLPITGDWDGQ